MDFNLLMKKLGTFCRMLGVIDNFVWYNASWSKSIFLKMDMRKSYLVAVNMDQSCLFLGKKTGRM